MLSVDYSAQLTESVRDSRLPASFGSNGRTRYTIHTHAISYRTRPKREVWVHEKDLAQGGFGLVQLQKRATRSGVSECRVIKSVRVAERDLALRRALYIRELDALAKFSHTKYSDFFVKFFGWYDSPGWIHIAMEYCEFGDLQSYLNNSRLCEDKRLPEDQAHQITSQLTDALLLMHGENFAHRDLKPANVLIKRQPPGQWWVKLCDLGLSKRVEDTASTAVRGTPGYMPPELLGFSGNPKTNPCLGDLWCLGELVYQTLTGEATFKTFADVGKYCSGALEFPLQPLKDLNISNPAMSFVKSLMAFEPLQRLSIQDARCHEWLGADSDSEASESIADTLDHSECPLELPFEHYTTDHSAQWTTGMLGSSTLPRTVRGVDNSPNQPITNLASTPPSSPHDINKPSAAWSTIGSIYPDSDTEREGDSSTLDYLRRDPHFGQLRLLVQKNPIMLGPILNQITATNSELNELFSLNSEKFVNSLQEGDINVHEGAPSSGTHAPTTSPKQQALIDQVQALTNWVSAQTDTPKLAGVEAERVEVIKTPIQSETLEVTSVSSTHLEQPHSDPIFTNLCAEERRAYWRLFRLADVNNTGFVSGDSAVAFFKRTRLTVDVLGLIWRYADASNTGFLGPARFGVALRLTGHAQAGRAPSADLVLEPGPLPHFDGFDLGTSVLNAPAQSPRFDGFNLKETNTPGPIGPPPEYENAPRNDLPGIDATGTTTIDRVRAICDYTPMEPNELELHKGDIIVVVESDNQFWGRGLLRGKTGLFLIRHVERLIDPTPDRSGHVSQTYSRLQTDINNVENPPSGSNSSHATAHGQAGGTLDFLRHNPQFQTLRRVVQQQPQMLEPILQQLGAGNPQLASLIASNPDEFLKLLEEDDDDLDPLSPETLAIAVTEEERDAIERLCRLGFDRDQVIQAYFACDKNEELTSNFLFDQPEDSE